MTEEQTEDVNAQPDESQESEDAYESKEELDDGAPGDIGDSQLPEDLQPTEDNPLARHPGQTGDEDDEIGADREEEPETAPLTEDDADYGGGAGGGS
jgi:hypothetical protein